MASNFWVLAAVLLAPISLQAETAEQLAAAQAETLKVAEENGNLAPSYWPWATSEAEKPPEIQTYQLPTLAGDGVDYHSKPAPLAKAPALDPDTIYKTVLSCYPEKSKFDVDISLRASVRSADVLDETDLSSGLGKSYVGIVANMPLYSSQELNREREREYMRRKDTAKAVADFIAAIASRNHSVRELALYRSLEARSAIRVQSGIVEATEQVGYLEKVATAQEKLVKEETKIIESRLLLAGMCDPLNAERIGSWLKRLSAVPPTED
ncbi:MAG: hypothetical protein E6Q83_16550 [Thiothrix sp.]|nr:MAG: hypothetical protein E6Q83_16550 [Thiothrix sp.]